MSRVSLVRAAKKWPRPPRVIPRTHAIPTQLAHVALWFHALSDVTRLQILQTLSHRERCVCELQELFEMEQPHLSFHLKVLRDAGLVRHRREGKWIYYGINAEVMEHIVSFTRSIKPGKHAGECMLDCCN
jgi:ArsR family transcriptional regulator, arsenate/arsenite/antimonite-responsive transcriptional repressor